MSSSSPPLPPLPPLGSVLVVGGCGFLGHHIVSQLLQHQQQQSSDSASASSQQPISVLDLHTTRNRFPNVSYHSASITSPTAVRAVLEQVRPAVIIHTASPTAVADGNTNNTALYTKVNIEGTKVLVEQAGEVGCVKAFVYTSSASVIHDTVGDLVNADERWPVLRSPVQREWYSETKGVAEGVVLAANGKYRCQEEGQAGGRGKMLTAAIRPAGIFGEGDVQLVPPMLKAFEKGQTKFQLGDGDNLFDFTYVGNVAHAHILAAVALVNTQGRETEVLDYERVDGEAFLITNDQPVYFWDFARAIWAAAGDRTTPGQVWVVQKDFGLVIATIFEWIFWIGTMGKKKPNLTRRVVNYSCMSRYYSIDKAKKRLGYKPIWGMVEGIERSMRWFREGGKFNIKGTRKDGEKKVQ